MLPCLSGKMSKQYFVTGDFISSRIDQPELTIIHFDICNLCDRRRYATGRNNNDDDDDDDNNNNNNNNNNIFYGLKCTKIICSVQHSLI